MGSRAREHGAPLLGRICEDRVGKIGVLSPSDKLRVHRSQSTSFVGSAAAVEATGWNCDAIQSREKDYGGNGARN